MIKFKIYNTLKDYQDKNSEINQIFGYPSKKYDYIPRKKRLSPSVIISNIIQHLVSKDITTLTYADLEPRLTELGFYVIPVLDYVKYLFKESELVEYNPKWWPEEDIEGIAPPPKGLKKLFIRKKEPEKEIVFEELPEEKIEKIKRWQIFKFFLLLLKFIKYIYKLIFKK